MGSPVHFNGPSVQTAATFATLLSLNFLKRGSLTASESKNVSFLSNFKDRTILKHEASFPLNNHHLRNEWSQTVVFVEVKGKVVFV